MSCRCPSNAAPPAARGEEHEFIAGNDGIHTFIAGVNSVDQILDELARITGPVYLSIDMDVFDPSAVPGVGVPEPGGLSWDEVTAVAKTVCTAGNVVAADVVELMPIPGQLASETTAAKLVWRLISYMLY